jgi:hypothetical protein
MFITFILRNFLVGTLQCFQKKFDLFFAYENMKKLRSKVAHNGPQTRALTSILTMYQYTYQVSVYWYLYLVGLAISEVGK